MHSYLFFQVFISVPPLCHHKPLLPKTHVTLLSHLIVVVSLLAPALVRAVHHGVLMLLLCVCPEYIK